MKNRPPLAFKMLKTLMQQAAGHASFVENLGKLTGAEKHVLDDLLSKRLSDDRADWFGVELREMPPLFKGDTEAYREQSTQVMKTLMHVAKGQRRDYPSAIEDLRLCFDRDCQLHDFAWPELRPYLENVFERFTGFSTRLYYENIKLKAGH